MPYHGRAPGVLAQPVRASLAAMLGTIIALGPERKMSPDRAPTSITHNGQKSPKFVRLSPASLQVSTVARHKCHNEFCCALELPHQVHDLSAPRLRGRKTPEMRSPFWSTVVNSLAFGGLPSCSAKMLLGQSLSQARQASQ